MLIAWFRIDKRWLSQTQATQLYHCGIIFLHWNCDNFLGELNWLKYQSFITLHLLLQFVNKTLPKCWQVAWWIMKHFFLTKRYNILYYNFLISTLNWIENTTNWLFILGIEAPATLTCTSFSKYSKRFSKTNIKYTLATCNQKQIRFR